MKEKVIYRISFVTATIASIAYVIWFLLSVAKIYRGFN